QVSSSELKSTNRVDDKREKVERIGNTPVEPEPEQGLTKAAENAIKPTVQKGASEGAQERREDESRDVRPAKYRVLADKNVNLNGSRVLMRAGKEINASQFPIAHLKRQGVQLEE